LNWVTIKGSKIPNVKNMYNYLLKLTALIFDALFSPRITRIYTNYIHNIFLIIRVNSWN